MSQTSDNRSKVIKVTADTVGDLCMNAVGNMVAGHEVYVHFVEGLKVTDSFK
jgi:hypothetical protein